MKQRHSFEHSIRIKIGLIFFIVILYFSGILIYSSYLKKNIDEQTQEIIHHNRVLSHTNHLISSVQQAQNITNAYLVSPRRIYRQQYDSITTDIHQQILEMKDISPEADQYELLENMNTLLAEKNRIVRELAIQFRTQEPLRELDEKIENYSGIAQDSLIVTTSKDTTIVVKEEKDFWTRFRGLFNPKQAPDTTINITVQEKDTLLKSRVDTTYTDLRTITEEVSKTFSTKIQGIERQVQNMILAEQNISLQISQLLTRLYNDAIHTVQQEIQHSRTLTQQIFTFAIVSGVLSLILIIAIIILIINDLNKGQRARMDLSKEKQLTENLMESRHKLLLSVSHDIKTPLSSMMGYLELWNMNESSEAKKQQIRSARNSGQYILSMLTNLLEFSRLEQNSGKLHYTQFDIMDIMEETISMFRPLTDKKNVTITFENRLTDHLYIESDYTVLKQILTNILSNSVKYTLEGSIRIILEKRDRVIFTVADTGVGIASEDMNKIFQPFSRIENPLKAEGSGFGLYVTKGLVESLNGAIRITSEEGKGTTVTVGLPLRGIKNLPVQETEETWLPENKAYRNILIMEDDIALGNMITEFLTQKGYRTTLCQNKQDIQNGIERISSFDIVFTDMEMKSINGYDILQAIRKTDPSIPVWLMTAYDDYSEDRALSDGFDGFIHKPIQMSMLDAILSGKESEQKDEQLQEKPEQTSQKTLREKFPSLSSLFEDDEKVIREILTKFVRTTNEDTDRLQEFIDRNDFREAQQLCHKMHPFLNQLNADHLCGTFRKMDKLRGQNETPYPEWKEELSSTILRLREFADTVQKEYLL